MPQVFVRDNDVNGALRVLKKKMQREGVFREMKQRRAYEKPSERAAREKAEGVRRRRKALIARFGGLKGISNAGVDQLTAVPGISR